MRWHRQQHTLKYYLALLTLGKNDFEAVKGFRAQRFAHQALCLCINGAPIDF